MPEDALTHQEYFAQYGVEIAQQDAEDLIESVGTLAGLYQAPVTLFMGRVAIQAMPDGEAVEVQMGSLPDHPLLGREEPE